MMRFEGNARFYQIRGPRAARWYRGTGQSLRALAMNFHGSWQGIPLTNGRQAAVGITFGIITVGRGNAIDRTILYGYY
jgi:hypothetical protein